MDEGEAAVHWHVLEGVPAGQEQVPRLLSGMRSPESVSTSWARLVKRLHWSTGDPLFPPIAAGLLEVLPDLDRSYRRHVLDFLAWRTHRARTDPRPADRQALASLVAGRSHVVPLLADADAGVRVRAAWFLGETASGDAEVRDALRNQAEAEADRTALVSQLIALGRLSESGAVVEESWFLRWSGHPEALVRAGAVWAVAPMASPAGAAGLGLSAGEAFAETGVEALSDVPAWPRRHEVVSKTAERLREHPREAVALAAALSGHQKEGLRRDALAAVATQLRYWRRPSAELWEMVVAGLDDGNWVAAGALDILADGGSAVAPYADRLVDFVERHPSLPDVWASNAKRAIQALVGADDDRALPWYRESFGDHDLKPGLPPARWAPELLPAFRGRLGEGPDARGVPEVLRILVAWGPRAAEAVPEVVALLDTPQARPAAEALGRIGPAAGAAAEVLAALARGSRRPPRQYIGACTGPRWHGSQTAAWAHWRLTGDPQTALDVIGAAVRAGFGHPVLSHLADLGPLAARHADDIRPLLDAPGEWTRVGAAEAWWRVTGDAATAVGVLLPALRPLADHRVSPLVLRATAVLGRIGRPAAAAVPLLEAVTTAERRYGGTILADEELCRSAAEALRAIA
ncbi:hypothetical protein [Streptomyces sp. NPDC049040]|uniref:hypothetical protein n=1 Tax=Streptomyces sp. NPDC049040 TaxID=3365593 RepID=UPI00371E80D6